MNEGTALSCTFPASAASAFALGMKERKKFSTYTDKKFKNHVRFQPVKTGPSRSQSISVPSQQRVLAMRVLHPNRYLCPCGCKQSIRYCFCSLKCPLIGKMK